MRTCLGSFVLMSTVDPDVAITYLATAFAFFSVVELRSTPTNRMILWLSVCDFFFSAKYMATFIAHGQGINIPTDPSEETDAQRALCYYQVVSGQFFGTASVSWTAMISINLLINSVRPFYNTDWITSFAHVWVWTLSGVSTVTIISLNGSNAANDPTSGAIGTNGDGTCWAIKLYDLAFIIPLLCYFMLATAALIASYVRISRSFATSQNETTSLLNATSDNSADGRNNSFRLSPSRVGRHRRFLIRMSVYVLLFIVLWAFATVDKVVHLSRTGNFPKSTVDRVMGAFCESSTTGFCNALVWLSDPGFWALTTKSRSNNMEQEKAPRNRREKEERKSRRRTKSGRIRSTSQVHSIDAAVRNYVVLCAVKGITKSIRNPLTDSSEGKLSQASFTQVRSFTEVKKSVIEHYNFIDYAPDVFRQMRQVFEIEDESYLESMEPHMFMNNLHNQHFSTGRSGSFFVFSPDKRYVLKTLTRREKDLLFSILKRLHEYVQEQPTTFINRIYGLHAVENTFTSEVVHLVVMENCLHPPRNIEIDERYDLKGSKVNRTVGKLHRDDPTGVLGMDGDFHENLHLSAATAADFIRQITEDSRFLASCGIMDYSLLIGIHVVKDNIEYPEIAPYEWKTFHKSFNNGMPSHDLKTIYYMGIIDVLQLWTSRKRNERFLKVHLLRRDPLGISAVEPKPYSDRFIEKMEKIVQVH
ncbi:hypothetical protein PROFUN_09658 [Planoprotostelium fungivorum]|uniref:PIPK domain-containing protein n=1 Tax=Planoprotostelium fungivorum TaxID=1890364 RepID=A0A2P6NGK7_9EUKA|nr:hypothetical protein PROFUN_09658 [Planoprotostelium fungivorum]